MSEPNYDIPMQGEFYIHWNVGEEEDGQVTGQMLIRGVDGADGSTFSFPSKGITSFDDESIDAAVALLVNRFVGLDIVPEVVGPFRAALLEMRARKGGFQEPQMKLFDQDEPDEG